jgi:hypothetical protein
MKNITEFILENEVSELFKRQDEMMKKMIERWKSDKSLKPLDSYFKWKSHEISTSDFRTLSKDDIMNMMNTCRELQDKNYNDNADDPKDWFKDSELATLLDAVEMELINIYPLFK